jgi:hypothetical protein
MTDPTGTPNGEWRFDDLRALYVIPEGAGAVNGSGREAVGVLSGSFV